MSAVAEFAARYSRIEREGDELGRIVGVKRLKPSQQVRIQGMTSDLDGDSVSVDAETGKEMRVPLRTPCIIAAAVVEIDGRAVTFPKNRAELDSILDALDSPGLEAAAKALARLSEGDQGSAAGIDAAKNSQASQVLDNSSGS